MTEEDWPPGHAVCEICGEPVCPDGDCVAFYDCMRLDNYPSASLWTAYQLQIHARCVEEFELELEDWSHESASSLS